MDDPGRQSSLPPAPARSVRREARRVAETLQAVGTTFLVVLLLLLVVTLALVGVPEPFGLAVLAGTLSLIGASLLLNRRGRPRVASLVLVGMTWLSTTAGIVGAGGIDSPGFSFYAVTIVAAGLLLGSGTAVLVTLLCGASGAAVAVLEARGLLPPAVIQYPGVATLWWIEMTLFAATASLVVISVRRIRNALGDAELSERDLEQRNLEISTTLAEKRRAEQSEALLHWAMGQAREAIAILDSDGQLRYVNQAFEELTGWQAGELEGGAARRFFGSLMDELSEVVFETLAGGRSWHGRVKLAHPREGLVDASVAKVVDPSGEVTHYVAVARDVTREAALESELHQSQKLEALGQLAGGVAHDFNNLLAVIQGYAEIVRSAQSDPEMRESVAQIEEASRQAADLTSQLLAFGRRQIHHPRVLDLNAVVRDAEGMIRALVPESIEIALELDPAPQPVRIDPRQVHQILLNLSANARDAMPEGGRLSVRTRQDEADHVVLAVRDTGQGMDADTREHIFEPFFTTKRPGEGTGLGLASVYGIVEQCGGTIDVESERDRGTCVAVRLPRTDEPLEGVGPEPGVTAVERRGSVLVVEDQENVRRLLGRQLRDAGFQALRAVDGRAALALLEEEPQRVDVLVTDVTMPRLGGAGLAERLRERWPDLPVLYISGYWPHDLVAKVEADPRADFLAKPFSRRELLAKVEELLALRDLK